MMPGNIKLIEPVANLYADYQQNKLTKGQYDTKRKALLACFKQDVVSRSIGWGTALVLAVGSAGASYGGGKFANSAYTAWGHPVDFVTGRGLGQVCR